MKIYNKIFYAIIITLVSFNLALAEQATNKELFMANTTSIADSGLLDYLSPIFEAETGYILKFISVGTGEAIAMGKNGDVDLIFVHDKAREEDFVKNGFGVQRFSVMYNDFIVVGPKKILDKSNSVKEFFKAIAESGLPFISRGDNSGTHGKEMEIWHSLKIDPNSNANYMEVGQGMGATLSMADERRAFTLTDRGTWLKISNDGDIQTENIVVFADDEILHNQYGVIAVNPKKFPEVNIEGATTFIKWITSEKTQSLIGKFGLKEYGQALFIPNAKVKP